MNKTLCDMRSATVPNIPVKKPVKMNNPALPAIVRPMFRATLPGGGPVREKAPL